MIPRLLTAVVTPFEENNTLHFEDLKKILEKQNDVGNGIVLFGTTGEGFSLSLKEKKDIVALGSSLCLKVPLFVTLNSVSLEECLDLINFCKNYQEIFGFLLATPAYSKPGPRGQEHWFRTLMEASSKPCLFYNNPGRSVVSIAPEAINNLKHHPHFLGIKDCGASLMHFLQYKNCFTEQELEKICLYVGDDYLFSTMASLKPYGLISIMSNVWPEATHCFVEDSLKGKSIRNIDLWIKGAFEIGQQNPLSIKTLLGYKGIIHNSTVRPPLHNKDSKNLENLLFYDHCVDKWYHHER